MVHVHAVHNVHQHPSCMKPLQLRVYTCRLISHSFWGQHFKSMSSFSKMYSLDIAKHSPPSCSNNLSFRTDVQRDLLQCVTKLTATHVHVHVHIVVLLDLCQLYASIPHAAGFKHHTSFGWSQFDTCTGT